MLLFLLIAVFMLPVGLSIFNQTQKKYFLLFPIFQMLNSFQIIVLRILVTYDRLQGHPYGVTLVSVRDGPGKG